LKDPLNILINFVVPKSEHAIAGILKSVVTYTVTLRVFAVVVLTTVDFDDQSMLQACKVDNVSALRNLSTKMKTACFPRSEMNPELYLLGRHRLT